MNSLSITAGYVRGEHNFVIQNLPAQSPSPVDRCVSLAQKLLLRGTPTRPSDYLLKQLKIDSLQLSQSYTLRLVGEHQPIWYHTILGADSGDNPAFELFHDLLPQQLGEYGFVLQLFRPECSLLDIVPDLKAHRVYGQGEKLDFYLPQARLVIEVDGAQHLQPAQRSKDQARDRLLLKRGITTLRLPVKDLKERTEGLNHFFSQLIEHLAAEKEVGLYKQALQCTSGIHHQAYLLTASLRFQLTLLELLQCGALSLHESKWCIELATDVAGTWYDAAVADLFQWLQPIAQLAGQAFSKPECLIRSPNSFSKHDSHSVISIDLSLLQRWTDENELAQDTIFVRSDYVQYWFRPNGRATRLDHYSLTIGQNTAYRLTIGGQDDAEKPLKALLKKLYGYDDFNRGQLAIIKNALSGQPTIGLLPTGGGKSLCYQMTSILQHGCCIVICPIRSLMRDQADEINQIGFFGRAHYLSSDQASDEKELTVQALRERRLQYLFISPERLQQSEFRELVSAMAAYDLISSIVIDEVHCLSEWGHDFRTSYLTLASTIQRCIPNIPVLCLTATASIRVLKDIQLEFDIRDENVCYLMDSSRKELSFTVINDQNNKKAALNELLNQLEAKGWGQNKTPGIIFTPHVNGRLGCFPIANELSTRFPNTSFFSGNPPKTWSDDEVSFEKHKRTAQDQFKQNESPILVATKAFGMGVNKPNVRFTVHYGMPSSMEALYQEAGRAGRDKQAAECYVLLSEEPTDQEEVSVDLHSVDTTLSELVQWVEAQGRNRSDFASQLWFLTNTTEEINTELRLCLEIVKHLEHTQQRQTLVTARHFGQSKAKVEKTLYRLYQAGLITDWTIEDFFRGVFLVDYQSLSLNEVADHIATYIERYGESDVVRNELTNLCNTPNAQLRQLLHYLLSWNYRHFVYNRRQSLKTLYDACRQFNVSGEKGFKMQLEAYFKVDSRTHRMQALAEAGLEDSLAALELLMHGTKPKLLGSEKVRILQGSLTRFLESYQDSPSLNLLSGIVRLMNDQFDDADGLSRFRHYVDKAYKNHSFWPNFIEKLAVIAKHLPMRKRNNLTTVICERCSDRSEWMTVHEAFEDEASAWFYLKAFSHQINELEYR